MLHINIKQSVFFQFGNNSNYMNMAEANNPFFAASEVGVCLNVSVHVLCVIMSFKRLEGKSKVLNLSLSYVAQGNGFGGEMRKICWKRK